MTVGDIAVVPESRRNVEAPPRGQKEAVGAAVDRGKSRACPERTTRCLARSASSRKDAQAIGRRAEGEDPSDEVYDAM